MIKRCSSRAVTGLGALGALCVAAGAILLSPAAAGDDRSAARAVLGQAKGLKYVVKQKTISDADPTLIVDCPQGAAPTGGGTFLDTADPANGQFTNSTPQPAGDPNQTPDEGWLSEGNPGPLEPSFVMLSYAICSDRPSQLRYRSDAEFVGAGTTDDVTVECPNGTALTGGGALTDSDLGDMILVASRPYFPVKADPTGWLATAHNYDSEQHSLVTYAICSKEKSKYSYKAKAAQISDGSPGSAHKVVDCPKGRAVSGGGAAISGGVQSGDAWLGASSPQPVGADGPPKKGWIAEGVSYEEEELLVWAICKK